jgi:hypothetical protein
MPVSGWRLHDRPATGSGPDRDRRAADAVGMAPRQAARSPAALRRREPNGRSTIGARRHHRRRSSAVGRAAARRLGRAPVNASSARVRPRRGIASCARSPDLGVHAWSSTNELDDGGAADDAEDEAEGEEAEFAAVTLSASRGPRSPVVAIPCPASVAAGFGRVNSDPGSPRARPGRHHHARRPAPSVQAEGGRW